MSFDSPPIPPTEEPKSRNTLLWGCLIVMVAGLVLACCAGTLLLVSLFSDSDPLGIDLGQRLEETLPQDLLEDLTSLLGLEDLQPEPGQNPTPPALLPAKDINEEESFPLAEFSFNDIGATFSYPIGWDIEVDQYTVTFYDPESYTYLYIGEDLVDEGSSAESVAASVLESLQEDAQGGSVELLSSGPYQLAFTEEAYLNLFEWVDQDGYYTWAYDLEIVAGESNFFFFLSGEDPHEIGLYGELLDLIASSLSTRPVSEPDADA